MSDTLLKVDGIVSGYGNKQILQGVSFEVGRGETVCLIGPNGAGKSTVLLTIMGYLKPVSGTITVQGARVDGKEPHEVIRLGVGFCTQRQNVFPDMTVGEHLDLGAWTMQAGARAAARRRVFGMFPVLQEKERQRARTLSGGQRQMVAFGMALMTNPALILLDEPTIGLAPIVVESIFATIEQIHREGVSILVVEQNAAKALAHSQRAYVLETGQNRHDGPSERLLADPKVREMYLGARH